jgi:hypothetical protein
MAQTDSPQTSWVTKATNTHSEYGILVAFLHQQLLREGTSMLRYAYIACLVYVQYRLNMQKLSRWSSRDFHACRDIDTPTDIFFQLIILHTEYGTSVTTTLSICRCLRTTLFIPCQ